MRARTSIVALIAVTAFFVACDKKTETAEVPENVIAKVGDQYITQADLEAELEMLAPQWRGRVKTESGRKNVIQNIVRRRLIIAEAEAKGLADQPKLRIELERLKSARLLNEMIQGSPELDEALLKQKFEQNKEKFALGERVSARHILLRIPPDANDKDVKAIENKAKRLAAKAKGGADFAQLAKDNSEGPSAPNGGDLGVFGRNKMDPKFESAAFALKEGEVSDPVRTSFGFHVIKVEKKLGASEPTYEEVKDQVSKKYKAQIQRERYEKFMASLEEKYPVDIKEAPAGEPASAKAPAKAEPANTPAE